MKREKNKISIQWRQLYVSGKFKIQNEKFKNEKEAVIKIFLLIHF